MSRRIWKDYVDPKNLTSSQKLQWYEQERKTANRRLRRLRENNYSVPYSTESYLESIGRRNFPKSISESDQLDSLFSNVVKFLENENSTITGLKKTSEEIPSLTKTRLSDPEINKKEWKSWRDELNRDQRLKLYDQYRKTANRRLRRLREAGFTVPAETRDYLERIERKNFKKISSDSEDWELNSALDEVEKFLDEKKSKLTGARQILNDVKNVVEARINKFRSDEYKVSFDKLNEADFYNFLHSKAFSRIRIEIDSDILIEDYMNAMEKGMDFDQIIEAYEEYLASEISFDEMQRRRKNKKVY